VVQANFKGAESHHFRGRAYGPFTAAKALCRPRLAELLPVIYTFYLCHSNFSKQEQ
jgi:hypothetical protein